MSTTKPDTTGVVGSWIATYSGRKFDPINPRAEDVDIVDIAHALSNACRWSGHCKRFYSVAQHSIEVSKRVPRKFAMCGLLHDASEAYIADIARPVKNTKEMEKYRVIESGIQLAVAKKFGIDLIMSPEIKAADNLELVTEAEHLFDNPPDNWHKSWGIEPRKEELPYMNPEQAEAAFLERYAELGGS